MRKSRNLMERSEHTFLLGCGLGLVLGLAPSQLRQSGCTEVGQHLCEPCQPCLGRPVSDGTFDVDSTTVSSTASTTGMFTATYTATFTFTSVPTVASIVTSTATTVRTLADDRFKTMNY
ncbi:unnamed protein product [Symbiodinium microadriaticum]|nr:unnamed protein product [Symbiodinium microadriaticum]